MVVTTTFAVEAFVPSRVTEEGETVQPAPCGRPEHLNIATRLNPPLGVTEAVLGGGIPRMNGVGAGTHGTEKFAGLPAAGTDCKACTKSKRPLPMAGPIGTA